jgi:hypothetical protein
MAGVCGVVGCEVSRRVEMDVSRRRRLVICVGPWVRIWWVCVWEVWEAFAACNCSFGKWC